MALTNDRFTKLFNKLIFAEFKQFNVDLDSKKTMF